MKIAVFSLKIPVFLYKNPDSVGGVYCYFRGDVASMTTSQELAMLPLYDVSSAALYWTVQPSCCHSYETTAVR